MKDADVFLGLSVKNCVEPAWLKGMKNEPLIMALANPSPEITPEQVKLVRPDAIMCTGRSDYPNQVNNVMAFPYIFRGSLDVRATTINLEMMSAVSDALASLARKPIDNKVLNQMTGDFTFGRNYIIPNPFDPRLMTEIPVKVAEAAMASGVSRIKIDLDE
mmetsp:Transcript_48631/g.105960  ORF Transcript_48631/g.105960 Transcript_48631/m.105960 type:complete len:161 (+) Transcript_48631:905-1387(+)